MGLQFHETMYGKNFFEHQLPRLTKAIEKLADQNNKQETVPSYPFQLANEETRQRLLTVMDDSEKAEAFARAFHEQFMTDGDSFASIGFHMARAIECNTAPLSSKTILEHHRVISTIMTQAEKEMLIQYNPASKATPPKVQRKKPDYYQPEEMVKILDALDSAPLKWKAATYLLIDTGCRRGEAMGLKWESIDLVNGVMTIERALLYSPQKGVYEGTPKTGKSRTMKLAPETLALLNEWKATQDENRIAYGDAWINTGYVFAQDNGDCMNPDSLTDWLGKFSKANGLPHIHPHAFRHTAASTMIANGVDIVTTANELGHASATTTATIYAHQIAEAKARAENVRAGIFKRA